MFKKYLSKLEAIIVVAIHTYREAIYILIQYFSWYYFSICRYRFKDFRPLGIFICYIHQRNIKLSFINSLLPIAGLLLTVFVVKRFFRSSIEKELLKYYILLLKASIIPKKQMYAQILLVLTVGLGGSAGLESPSVVTGAAFGSNYAQKYKLSYKDRTLLIGCGVAAELLLLLMLNCWYCLLLNFLLVDVSISAFTLS
jgi:CIC family chloride channel protein